MIKKTNENNDVNIVKIALSATCDLCLFVFFFTVKICHRMVWFLFSQEARTDHADVNEANFHPILLIHLLNTMFINLKTQLQSKLDFERDC